MEMRDGYPQGAGSKKTDADRWKEMVLEELNGRQHQWSYLAYRAATTAEDRKALEDCTRTEIAYTYIHKLAT